MAWKGWEDWKPPAAPADPNARAQDLVKVPKDRGSQRGAKRCIVTDDLQLIDHQTAKDAKVKGRFFQSRKEAKRYIYLTGEMKAGRIRQCADYVDWKQVTFNLITVRPDGLKQVISTLRLDFVYEREEPAPDAWLSEAKTWVRIYEDVKPSGGHREDTYLLKKKIFEAQYGVRIYEF